MVKNPFVILIELFVGLSQQTWDTITFSLSKLWEFLQALSYYASQNLGLAILSALFASVVTYFVLKHVYTQIPMKLIYYAIIAIFTIVIVLIILGSMFPV